MGEAKLEVWPLPGITHTKGLCGNCDHRHPVRNRIGINLPEPCECGCETYAYVFLSYTVPEVPS